MTNPFFNHRLGREQSQATWYGEDMIDFPCAPCWVSYYAMEGMTQDYPPEFYWGEKLSRLRQEIEDLKEEVQLLRASEALQFPVRPELEPKPKSRKSKGVKL